MPPMDLPWSVCGRPIKPVSLVLMNTMLILGFVAITDKGLLQDSEWADIIGLIALGVAIIFIVGFWRFSQKLNEYALIGAFFVWGVRFWGILLTQGVDGFSKEAGYLAIMWMLLAAGSWLLERSDPAVHRETVRGSKWTPR